MRPQDYHIVSGLLPPFVFCITSYSASQTGGRGTEWKDKIECKSTCFLVWDFAYVFSYFFDDEVLPWLAHGGFGIWIQV